MPMTPQDIQSQQFHVRFRGFDVEEVDNFLEKVAEEYLVLMEENQELQDEIDKLRKEIDSYRSREKSFQNAIMSAQQIAEEMKIKSRKESQEIVAAAREEALQLQKDAKAEAASLVSEVERLQKMKTDVGSEIRGILQNYLAQLEQGFSAESSSPAPGNSPEEAGTIERFEETGPAPDEEDTLVDLSEFYGRIELSGEEIPKSEERQDPGAAAGKEGLDPFQTKNNDLPASDTTVPELDGDLMFTLDDPYEGPEVFFEEEEEEEKEAGGGK